MTRENLHFDETKNGDIYTPLTYSRTKERGSTLLIQPAKKQPVSNPACPRYLESRAREGWHRELSGQIYGLDQLFR